MLSGIRATTANGCRLVSSHQSLRSTCLQQRSGHMLHVSQIASPTTCAPAVLQGVNNFRDLHEAYPEIAPGKLFRGAAPIDGTVEDLYHLINVLRISDLIDLRAEEELAEADDRTLLFQNVPIVRYTRPSWTAQVRKEVVSGSWTQPGRVRHHVSLLDRRRYIQGMLKMIPFSTSIPALFTGLYDGPKSKELLINAINAGGLEMLYQVLLRTSHVEFVVVLRLVVEALEGGRPLMFFCKAGKDRTGLVAMLVLACCGASEQQIVEDYHRSHTYHKVALAGMENRPELAKLDRAKFEASPREAMESTLQYIRREYGGATAYLDTMGFSYAEQKRLRSLLVDGPVQGRL